jgi:hypothetical protein
MAEKLLRVDSTAAVSAFVMVVRRAVGVRRSAAALSAASGRIGRLLRPSNDLTLFLELGLAYLNYLVCDGRVIDVYLNGTISDLATRRDDCIDHGGVGALIKRLQERTENYSGSKA